MNSKSLFLIAGLGASVCLTPVWAQGGGGAGGAAGGAGSAGASSGTGSAGGTSAGAASAGATSSTTAARGSTSVSTAADGATSSTGITTGATGSTRGSAPGTPNMSPTMPSRSVLNTEGPPNTAPTPAGERAPLPSGLSVAPAQPGISPLSGLPVAEIPAVSRGTTPLGPNAAGTTAPTKTTGNADAPVATTHAPTINDPAAIAAHPQTNPLIGMGTTTVVPTPPPALRTEATPATTTNDRGQVWVAGHYSWVGGQWTWVDGTWQRPPGNDAAWVPGNYDAQNKRWTEGHWETNTSLTTRGRERTSER